MPRRPRGPLPPSTKSIAGPSFRDLRPGDVVAELPPFLAILGGALVGGAMAVILQPALVLQHAAVPDLPTWIGLFKGVWEALATGFVFVQRRPGSRTLLSRGGMDSMLNTIWLIITALAFGSVMQHAGMLDRIVEPAVRYARSSGRTRRDGDRLGGRHEHRCRRPVPRRRPARPDVQIAVREPWPCRLTCFPGASAIPGSSRHRSCLGTAAAPTWQRRSASAPSISCRTVFSTCSIPSYRSAWRCSPRKRQSRGARSKARHSQLRQ